MTNPHPQAADQAGHRARSRWVAQAIYLAATPFALVAVLLLVFPSPFMALGFVALPGLLLLRCLALGTPFPRTGANGLLLLFLAAVAVSLVISPTPKAGVIIAGQVLAGLILVLIFCDRAEQFEWLAAFCVGVGLLLALATPFTVVWGQEKLFTLPAFYGQTWLRITETANSNIMAGALVPLIPLALTLAVSAKSAPRAIGVVALAPLAMTALLLQSRAALGALAVGFAVYVTLHNKWLLPLVPVVGLVLLAWGSAVVPLKAPQSPDSFSSRPRLWAQAMTLLPNSPVFGIGLGSYPQAAIEKLGKDSASPEANHAHNLFLQVALDTGLVGLLGFGGLIVVVFLSAWRVYRRRAAHGLAIGLIACLIVLIVDGMLDTVVWGTKASIVFWLVIALGLALERATQHLAPVPHAGQML